MMEPSGHCAAWPGLEHLLVELDVRGDAELGSLTVRHSSRKAPKVSILELSQERIRGRQEMHCSIVPMLELP